MKHIVGFFAGTVLVIAASIPAPATEVGGTISEIDRESGLIRLGDGSTYAVPANLDLDRVALGMDVVLIVNED